MKTKTKEIINETRLGFWANAKYIRREKRRQKRELLRLKQIADQEKEING